MVPGMFIPTDHHRHFVTKEDLMSQKESRPKRWLGPSLETDDQVLRGAIGFVKLEDGLTVHFSNAEDLHDLTLEAECGPRICVSLFLEGQIDAFIGDFKMPMPVYDPKAHHWTPAAMVFSQSKPEKFVRIARKGARIKKVILSISHEWLFGHLELSDQDFGAFKEFAERHFATLKWTPSAHAISLAEQIIAAPNRTPFQHKLYIATRAYGLLEEAFQKFSSQHTPAFVNAVDGKDRPKLESVERFLTEQQGHWITADELAATAGMSPNSLQRLLNRTYGLSTSRFIRRFMLEKAREALERDGLTITEAAHISGYSSPANFSTAFKREFGLSPKQVT